MAQALDGISLAKVEGVHIGGTLHELHGFAPNTNPRPGMPTFDNNGHHMLGQMYAQYFWQSAPRMAAPVAFWHGGGLTAACWENTPDDRGGWVDHFLREKFNVALCDAFERGRASLPPYPQAIADTPEYRSIDSIWHHFRFGPAGNCPAQFTASALRAHSYAGLQFPVEHLEQFGRQFAPRFTSSDAHILAAYTAFLQRTGPCILVAHSQGASFALDCARRMPAQVLAVVVLETAMSAVHLDQLSCAAPGPLPPHLFVWGDYIRGENGPWSGCIATAERYHEMLGERGGVSTFMELPRMGISGNSHMLMMEANSERIAALVCEWLVAQVG